MRLTYKGAQDRAPFPPPPQKKMMIPSCVNKKCRDEKAMKEKGHWQVHSVVGKTREIEAAQIHLSDSPHEANPVTVKMTYTFHQPQNE
jgi:hypothetical protein